MKERDLFEVFEEFSFSDVITWEFCTNVFVTLERWRGENYVNFPNFDILKNYKTIL